MRLAFGYKSRVGKDTCVDYLISKYGGKKLSFASPLYDILHYAQRACGFEQVKDRKFLQYVGTEWARGQNNSVWLDKVKEQLRTDPEPNLYISDLRFCNEFEMLRKQGVTLIRLDSDRALIDDHESSISLDETTDDMWDYIIENNRPLPFLFQALDEMVAAINDRKVLSYEDDFIPGVSIDQTHHYRD